MSVNSGKSQPIIIDNKGDSKMSVNSEKYTTVREGVKICLVTPLHLRNLLRKGKVRGKLDSHGRWLVELESLMEYTEEKEKRYQERIRRIKSGENPSNVRPTVSTVNRMVKKINEDTKLTVDQKRLFISTVNRYGDEWTNEYNKRKEKRNQ